MPPTPPINTVRTCDCCHLDAELLVSAAGYHMCRACAYEGCSPCSDVAHFERPDSTEARACAAMFCLFYAGGGRR